MSDSRIDRVGQLGHPGGQRFHFVQVYDRQGRRAVDARLRGDMPHIGTAECREALRGGAEASSRYFNALP